jgi:(p)ppGpp synthase/HD superfamily hydrolase
MNSEQELKLFKAFEFSMKAHEGQFRKVSKTPYIVHPIGVVSRLIRCNCDPEVAMAAVLHDTLEDTSTTENDLLKSFGETVLSLVKGVSELPKSSYSWQQRKENMLERLLSAPLEIILISCADKLDNLASIRKDLEVFGESVWKQFNAEKGKQKKYYKNCLDIFSQRLSNTKFAPLVNELNQEFDLVFRQGEKHC